MLVRCYCLRRGVTSQRYDFITGRREFRKKIFVMGIRIFRVVKTARFISVIPIVATNETNFFVKKKLNSKLRLDEIEQFLQILSLDFRKLDSSQGRI